jgi:hypothetical protein
MTKKEVETVFLDYSIEPYEMDKELGDSKGLKENPLIKHALTKANCFEWAHFGEYADIKRKGRPPTTQATTKTKKNIEKQNDDDEEEETSKGEEE